jgi:hypothetical protein
VEPPAAGPGYWATKRARRETVAAAVSAALAAGSVDVVASALHAGPGVVAAAAGAGVPAVLFLHSHEALCKYAFDAGSECVPATGCAGCPAAAALPPGERRELIRSRREHERSLAGAAALVATGATLAASCEAWCGRHPAVVAGATRPPADARADRGGHLLLAAARWSTNKGSDLLEPLSDALAAHRLVITEDGLEEDAARRLRDRPNVRVVPKAPIGELLEGAAAVLVPSRVPEAFGRVAFEGMAAGVPTLASAVGGLREHVPPEQLVPAGAGAAEWRGAVESLFAGASWDAARERGRAAARAVLDTDPGGRVEAVLLDAAASAVALGGAR